MSIVFSTVRAVQFGPFDDVTFDLSCPGLTLVEGEMQGVPGCNNNGAGKSFLLEAIAWASFGRCLRSDYTGDDVVKHGAKGGTMVEVSIKGDVNATWRKYRGHPVHKDKLTLSVDGKDVTAGTNPQTQLQIERLLGYDFNGFTTTTAFGARDDVKSFFAASDTDRKRLLDSILRLDRFDNAWVTANAKLKTAMTDHAALASKVTSVQSRISELKTLALEVGSVVIEETDVNSLRVRHKLALRELDKVTAQEGEAKSKLTAAKVALSNAQAKHQSAVMAASNARSKAAQTKGAADAMVTSLASQVAAAEKKLATIDSQVGKPCGSCGQIMGKPCLAGAIKAQQTTIDALKADLAAKKTAAAAITVPAAAAMPAPPSGADVEAAQVTASELAGRAYQLRTQADAVLGELEALEEKQKQAAVLQKRITEQEGVLAKLEEAFATSERTIGILTFWVEGFGKSGLKSFLLESELASINATATTYAQRLLGFGARINLSATRKLKTKDTVREELSVDATIPGCTLRYAGASKGQKRRLDLALLLALRDVATVRAGVRVAQFFADEVFDGVDKAGCETVGVLLKELSTLYPITLITHTNALKSIATRVLRVVHTGKSASLVAV